MVRLMKSTDIDSIADLHCRCFAGYEISALMGREYLKNGFYQQLLDTDSGFVYVYEIENKIIAFATGIYDNIEFNKRLRTTKFRLTFLTIIRLFLQRKLVVNDIKNMLDTQVEKAIHHKAHLGALALDKEYQKGITGGKALKEICNSVLTALREAGVSGAYGVTDTRNVSTQKLLKRLGFTEGKTIKTSGRDVVIYEIGFDNDR